MSSPAPASSGENTYKDTQAKLKAITSALDAFGVELEGLHKATQASAKRSHDLAVAAEAADFDARFISPNNDVTQLLGGAAVEIKTLQESAADVAAQTARARKRHEALYEGLDEIRSGRRVRTPKAGLFDD